MSIPKIILMYHGVIAAESEVPSDREPGAELYDVRLEDFRFQMHKVRELCAGGSVDSHKQAAGQVTLTFDDGEMNNFYNVFPLLKEFNCIGIFFVTAGRIGRPGYMGPAELQIMSNAGMTIGSHGLSHGILTELDEDSLSREMESSKRIIEQATGRPVTAFSVPRGFWDERVIAAAKSAGYQEIFVSQENPAGSDVLCRLAVKGDWSIDRFVMALRGEVPLGEKFFIFGKNAVKRFLGDKGYDRVRTKLTWKR